MASLSVANNTAVLQATPDQISQTNQEVLEAISIEKECCEELDHLETNLSRLKQVLDVRKLKSKRVRTLMEQIGSRL